MLIIWYPSNTLTSESNCSYEKTTMFMNWAVGDQKESHATECVPCSSGDWAVGDPKESHAAEWMADTDGFPLFII